MSYFSSRINPKHFINLSKILVQYRKKINFSEIPTEILTNFTLQIRSNDIWTHLRFKSSEDDVTLSSNNPKSFQVLSDVKEYEWSFDYINKYTSLY